MKRISFVQAILVSLSLVQSAIGQNQAVPIGDKEPLLRLEAGGPTSFVTSLAFRADGKRLYAAGLDKVVRVWTLDDATGQFTLDRAAYRIPIGPGSFGMINAIALSEDGAWLAVGGIGVVRDGSGFRRPGLVVPAIAGMSDEMRQDEGSIYLFDTRAQTVRLLRGHRGPILNLAFGPTVGGRPQLLVSAAREWNSEKKAFEGGVRIWDAVGGKQIGNPSPALPDPGSTRPELAPRRSGGPDRSLEVGIAWMDGKLRIWNNAAEEPLQSAPDGKDNRAIVALGSDRYVSGSSGLLRGWTVGADGKPEVDAGQQSPATPRQSQLRYIPAALALASSGGNGTTDTLVAALTGNPKERSLLQLRAGGEAFGTIRAEAPLWLGAATIPALATAPRGKHVAVAGAPDHVISIYAIADLLQGKNQPQLLRSAGTDFQAAAFAKKGDDLGLLLSEKAEPGQAEQRRVLVYDFKKRTLSDDRTGWAVAMAAPGDWRVTAGTRPLADGSRAPVLTLSHQNQPARVLDLKSGQVVTAYALLPAGKWKTPLLAAAVQANGVPTLTVYAVGESSIEPVRQLSGHTNPVRSLTFSSDGRLLVSSGDDQTVNVWSLISLERVLGLLGQLNGVAVKQQRGGPLVIGSLDESALLPANKGKLKEGEAIEAILQGGEAKKLSGAIEFYDTIRLVRPGQNVVLRIRDAAENRRDVALGISQGMDEWKPLLSLFVTRGARIQDRDWIGWSPLGFYDANNRRAERNLGLHFNTGRAEEPTRFAFVDQYRADHYREGILSYLVAIGSLSPALEQWKKDNDKKPLPRPGLTMWLDELGLDPKLHDARGRIIVQDPKLTLKLAVDNFPVRRIDSLEWQFDDQPAVAFKSPLDAEWTADLAALPWTRGDHRLRVTLRTEEADAKTYTSDLRLRYVPKPPGVVSAAPLRTNVEKPEWTLRARVTPGAEPKTRIQIVHRAGDRELSRSTEQAGAAGEMAIDKRFDLRPGENLFEVIAVNDAAQPDLANLETTIRTFFVTYSPPRTVLPPLIGLKSITELMEDGLPGETIDVEPGRPLLAAAKRVRLNGSIEAADPLTAATFADVGKDRTLAGFAKRKDPKLFVLAEVVELKPGANQVRLTASTTGGKSTASLAINYRPALPEFTLTAPTTGLELVVGKDAPEVAVLGRFTNRRSTEIFEASVLANEKAVAAQVHGDSLEAKVPLQPGKNRLRIQLRNAYNAAWTSDEIEVNYLRPPRVLRVTGPMDSGKPLAEVSIEGESTLPLTKDSVIAEVNGRPIGRAEVKSAADKAGLWEIRLPEVPLEEGANRVQVWLRNAEGRAAQPGEWTINHRPQQPASPPEVKYLEPNGDVKLLSPTLSVRLQIQSSTPIKRVDLVRSGRKPLRISVPLDQLKSLGGDRFEFERSMELIPNENLLRVEAVNDGGERRAELVANYIHTPVRVFVDRLETIAENPAFLDRKSQADGQISFPQAASGRLWMHGRVAWDQESDEQLKNLSSVHVFANDVMQLPGELRAASAGARERSFRVPLFLNRAKDNQVEIQLPGLKEEASSRQRFSLDCADPDQGQRLHLLIVGIGERDDKLLTNRVLSALIATPTAERQFRTPAFQKGQVYGPLTGFVRSRQVYHQLHTIRHAIRALKQADLRTSGRSLTDVVLLYYQGVDSTSAGSYTLLTSESLEEPASARNAIVFEDLARQLGETPAARVVLLETARAGKSGSGGIPQSTSDLSDENKMGVLQSSWQAASAAPTDARLLYVFEETLAQSRKLRDVSNRIVDKFGEVSQRYPDSFSFLRKIGPGLGELSLGGK